MDRRRFLSRLIVGVAAAPALVSSLAKAPPPVPLRTWPVMQPIWMDGYHGGPGRLNPAWLTALHDEDFRFYGSSQGVSRVP